MYKVFCDGVLMHSQYVKDLCITDAVVSLVQNDIGSFDFTLTPNNPFVDNIKKKSSLITVYQDDYLLFKGYAIDTTIAFDGSRKVKCKEFPYVLTYSNSRTYEYQGTIRGYLEMLISRHNEQVSAERQFTVGKVQVGKLDSNDYINRSDTEYYSTWDNIQNELINLLGGYILFRYQDGVNYIDYVDDFDAINAQEINFGDNLLSCSREESGLDIFTVLIPLGAVKDYESNERLTIAEVNDGKDYLENADGIAKYGRITKCETWDNVTEAANLKTKGQTLLETGVNNVLTITLTAIDLSNVSKDITSFRMGGKIKTRVPRMGINSDYIPQEMEIHLFKHSQDKITLNDTSNSLTDYEVGANKAFQQNVMSQLSNISTTAKDAKPTMIEEYAVTDQAEVPPLTKQWSTDIPEWQDGMFTWHRFKIVYGNGDVEYTTPCVVTGNSGQNGKDGQDAVNLRIDSSRGTIFKNNSVGTVLSVVIFYGNKKIETSSQLSKVFGITARLEWEWQRIDEDRFGVISASDSRLEDKGFRFNISPDDVDTKTVFRCNLIY